MTFESFLEDYGNTTAHCGYLLSIVLFVLGIKRLSKIRTARAGNALAALGMFVAVVAQLIELQTFSIELIAAAVGVGALIGVVLAFSIAMTAMPQLVAVFNGFGGAASTLVALSLYFAAPASVNLVETEILGTSGVGTALSLLLSIVIGAVTFSGSILAYMKLSDTFGSIFGKAILLPGRHILTLLQLTVLFGLCSLWLNSTLPPDVTLLVVSAITCISLLLGVHLVLAIGGADMPVVVSLLNSYSGLAASATGFALNAPALIVSGALVGASGLILTSVMCKGMNRSLASVILGGFGAAPSGGSADQGEYHNVKSAEAEEAVLDFEAVRDVIIVPGYGLAVAQGQGAVAEFAEQLKSRGIRVRYAIHPVAGRMPGHMNVLLAESKIPYDELFEMDEINKDFSKADIALVVGANDVVNPSAKDDPSSPLYGMPVLNVTDASMVYVIKRSLSPGFAGVKNSLFEKDNCRMIFGDAKKVLEDLASQLELELAA